MIVRRQGPGHAALGEVIGDAGVSGVVEPPLPVQAAPGQDRVEIVGQLHVGSRKRGQAVRLFHAKLIGLLGREKG